MKKFIKYTFLSLLAISSSGCADYLDVVPDKTQEITLLFERRESAYRALATCYHYLPIYENTYGILGSSDEMIMTYDRVTPGKQVMMGSLNANYTVMSYWSGDVSGWNALGGPAESLFNALRICNTFLENIMKVPDMTQAETNRWAAEVEVLKAYYHFLLFTQYGPIPIVDRNLPIDATGDELMVKRQPVDDVVKYITDLLDKAIAVLPQKISSTSELGRMDKVIATSLKGKVLLFAASPLFNNNSAYASFKDKDGRLLFPTGDAAAERQKWIDAADALKDAIDIAELNGSALYKYEATVPEYDQFNFENDPDRLQYMYNHQFSIVEKWNKEVIWGLSRINTDWWEVRRAANFKVKGESSGDAWQWFNPTMNAAEFYYTKNGLPMNEDPEFDYENRYDLATIPASHNSVAIEGEQTVKMHLNREPRFYASIGFDRSRVRGYSRIHDLKIRFGNDNGRQSQTDIDNSVSGYFLRKVIHPDTKGDGTITRYPWPIIRLADLYLSYAEALNEAYGEERRSEVLSMLNAIRDRAGIPIVEKAWEKAKQHPNYYMTKDGMREIIQQERTIELAFEGWRNDDIRRWRRGDKFNEQIFVWNVNEPLAEDFYQRTELKQLLHVFSSRNYLWPIPTNELVNNTNLVQNPGY